MKMQVADYYRQSSCEKQAEFLKATEVPELIVAQKKLLSLVCKELVKGSCRKELLELTKEQVRTYQEEWFDYSFLKEKTEVRDYLAIVRFLDWYENLGAKALQADVECVLPLNKITLYEKASLIIRMPSGDYRAFLLSFSKPKKTKGGRSIHTNISTDLGVMTVKAGLEEKYPDIKVYSLSMIAGDDTLEMLSKQFLVDKKGGNGYFISFENYLKKEQFQMAEFLKKAEEAVATPMQSNCYSCSFRNQCHIVPLERSEIAVQSDSYRMPEFTEKQKTVVDHKDGALLVCAGPGSGKTATLIGRIKALIEKGVDPAFILVVTFTKEAAKELKNRCLSFLKDYELPYISTLHALCYDILKSNKELFGKELKVLGAEEAHGILDVLTQAHGQLAGFSYGKKTGKNGLLETIERRMKSYKNDDESFFLHYPEIDRKQFSDFVREYDEIVSERGLITFDEQISLAITLFKEHPEVLKTYQQLFQYIMVDEYQDVDETQAELVYLLGAHGNVCVVGDDDQSIYGFRGGSPKYMTEFRSHFSARTVVLNDNFRSRETIVNASNKLIEKNSGRIQKDLVASRSGGQPVTIVPKQSAQVVENIIHKLHKNGTAYKDIAVLNFSNAPLEKLESDLRVPCRLSKATLVEDGFFRIVFDSIRAWKEGFTTEVLADYEKAAGLYGLMDEFLQSGPEIEKLRYLNEAVSYLRAKPETAAGNFIKYLSFLYDMDNTVSSDALNQMIQDKHIRTLDTLYQTMKGMIEYGDETRIQYGEKDEVCLITSHDSKGKEFPVVILYDGDRYGDDEESRRLLYVALTRAKDQLFVLCDKPNPVLSELGVVNNNYL
ncbi:MAG: ATP-dependent helicase [Lachnospiraceae bacterium]|nr:ATP-dependent helicase [Lachnospiraceae bacterium]